MDDTKRIIEINGVKLELDLRQAEVTQIDTFKVGDNVKVLVKSPYSEPKILPGVIVGFDNFRTLPTIIVAYLTVDYNKATIDYAYINDKSETEIVATSAGDVPFERDRVLELLDRDVAEKEEALKASTRKRALFLSQFGKLFASVNETAQSLVDSVTE